MRGKDIATLATLIGLAWGCFKGIDAGIQRVKKLEAMIIAQNISLGNIQGKLRDIEETLNQIQYPERYPRRHKNED